ncbi:MAG: hypothetical protein K2X36_04820 [Microbacteriaceae bacterium]|nr:hypothetical protein [Microbacteriaceae bacterium]
MTQPNTAELITLVEQWGAHFGWYDGRIDLGVTDLSSFTIPDCTLTAHAPVWGTRAGSERAIPIAEVRKRLAGLVRFVRATRHDMHVAFHPDGKQICLSVQFKARPAFLPVTIRTEPLAFVLRACETPDGLRICAVDEWSAADPDAARLLLIEHHGWPIETALHPQVAFGAAS